MKLNVLILVLFLIISSNSNNLLDSFSIDGFKYYLKNNGLFEIIQSIKNAYGQDVAIISCEELNRNYNGNCKKIVMDYMKEKIKPKPVNTSNSSGEEEDATSGAQSIEVSFETQELEKQALIYWKIMKNSTNIFYKNIFSSKKKFKSIELKSIDDKIIKRVESIHLNSTNDFLAFLHSSIEKHLKCLN